MASTTLPASAKGWSGGFEESSGLPESPPPSPPPCAISDNAVTTKSRPSSATASRRGGAAYHITEECERLFCKALKRVFLVEGNTTQDSLVMDMYHSKGLEPEPAHYRVDSVHSTLGGDDKHAVPFGNRAQLESERDMGNHGLVQFWIEMWDYVGGARFRGFVAEKGDQRAMLVFFDRDAVVEDLKPGIMALLELCSVPDFSCSQLLLCLDRSTPPKELQALTHDLGWVGFEPATLADWTKSDDIISDRWIFLGMDL